MSADNLRRLYVGHLPTNIRKFELRKVFERFGGVVDIYIPMKRQDGKVLEEGYGYAFVEMQSEVDAARAIAGLNGSTIDQKNNLRVRLADKRTSIST